jgi:hypothetical protein
MRLTFLLALLIAVPVAAQNKPLEPRSRCELSLAIIFSPEFTLCLPPSLLKQAAIAKADDLVVKFYDGSYFFGKIITSEMDGFEPDFDMRRYPEYVLGIREASELPPEQAGNFKRALEILRYRMPNYKVIKSQSGKLTTYLMYGGGSAEAFVVSDSTDQALQVGFSKIDLNTTQGILKGVK